MIWPGISLWIGPHPAPFWGDAMAYEIPTAGAVKSESQDTTSAVLEDVTDMSATIRLSSGQYVMDKADLLVVGTRLQLA